MLRGSPKKVNDRTTIKYAFQIQSCSTKNTDAYDHPSLLIELYLNLCQFMHSLYHIEPNVFKICLGFTENFKECCYPIEFMFSSGKVIAVKRNYLCYLEFSLMRVTELFLVHLLPHDFLLNVCDTLNKKLINWKSLFELNLEQKNFN